MSYSYTVDQVYLVAQALAVLNQDVHISISRCICKPDRPWVISFLSINSWPRHLTVVHIYEDISDAQFVLHEKYVNDNPLADPSMLPLQRILTLKELVQEGKMLKIIHER
jgi:hypothetical protein